MGFAEAKWLVDEVVRKGLTATIIVNTDNGNSVTFSKGSTNETMVCSNGKVEFKAKEFGEWNIVVKNAEQSRTKSFEVQLEYMGDKVEVNGTLFSIYGIKRDTNNPSTAWTRTDDSVGLTATASIGTQAGYSDFSDCYPWSEMKRQNISGDVMVKIPEFWYKRWLEGSVEYIQIADGQVDGFSKHPGSGCYIAAYKTSQNNRSLSGQMPTVDQTRGTMRSNARSKGSGWGIMDLMTWNAIQMLYLVEFADNNSEANIGEGYMYGNSSAIATGSCDSVAGLTGRAAGTDGKTDIVYRGIEGLWGNVYEWLDGIVVANNKWWICTNPNNYTDGSNSGHFKLSYKGGNSSSYNGWIKKMGVDTSNSWAMLASEYGGSDNAYYPDHGFCCPHFNYRHPYVGGYWSYSSDGGLFRLYDYTPSGTDSRIGARLLYKP